MVAPSFSQGVNLWEVVINPINLKSKTLPLASLRNQYSINFHLAWLGFFSAFLSWFAFSPLIPDAIKQDLKLTPAQIGNSNVVALCATLFVRVLAGPLIDRYGPRKVMAGLLFLGAIPSGLAGTAHTANGLYVIRFFIGILGGTFVPCQAWTTVFFDKNVVGTANALAGGWGNAGGGVTFAVMIALYNGLLSSGLASKVAWRAAFVIVPVPFLLLVATAVMVFGTDHPAGKWSDRHKAIAHASDSPKLDQVFEDEKTLARPDESKDDPEKRGGLTDIQITVAPVEDSNMVSELDYAVNEPLTTELALKIISTPLTWLPALAYFTTFGFELAIDANLANILLSLYKSKTFGQTKAGYIAAIFGLLNIFSRPLGGYFGDLVYRRWGVPGKKHLLIFFGVLQGLLSLGLGIYIDSHHHPSLAVVIVFLVILALANEAANGVNFSLVPHCNPCSNGFMSGMVGGMGNFGGIVFAMVFRFQPVPVGKAFWISGIIAMVINLLISVIRVPLV
ncbi:major facilitator superfamily domain-containing protein [Boletus edulis]|uniref:Nitrate/nitrite transporter n=1 Tax=Boletus edulis BED1 TaxID=1328754 RepID=A0AAD4BI75_BOLED|nr:major facilitator superfamily domain-containing protein [Boletus edulis]KAF8430833.1 major facilitator superfamily domain-containing protein [Boletus edulis BED1]KAF8437900.1 major facilitator superfamily domain-containing protein [Boletus edulis BED1]